MHYGSFGEQHVNGQDDPLEVQREIEALQRVVAQTSEYGSSPRATAAAGFADDGARSNMVDVFEIAPSEAAPLTAPASYALAGQEARAARYQNLLSKLAVTEELGPDARVDWAPRPDDTIEMQQGVPTVNAQAGEPLVGNFTDAATAAA